MTKAVPKINCDFKANCYNHLQACFYCDRNADVTVTQDNYLQKSQSFLANQLTCDKTKEPPCHLEPSKELCGKCSLDRNKAIKEAKE